MSYMHFRVENPVIAKVMYLVLGTSGVIASAWGLYSAPKVYIVLIPMLLACLYLILQAFKVIEVDNTNIIYYKFFIKKTIRFKDIKVIKRVEVYNPELNTEHTAYKVIGKDNKKLFSIGDSWINADKFITKALNNGIKVRNKE
ncbi:MAG: hypothetical protein J6A59_04140 [Lachnospiraceae bacterium]|nr:hypothetical protein [Lachnospiraceae bacterium]